MNVSGKENLPKNGPYILAPNHIDNIDPFPLSAAMKKPITYLMAEDQNPLKWYEAWAPTSYGVLLVNRKKIQPSTIKALHKQIKKNEIVCIFPEGTALSTKLKEGKNGASFFAVRHEIPIIPVAIFGTEKVLPALKRFKRTNINITFGKPIFTRGEDKKKLSELTKKTMNAIRKMLPEEYC
ncbi:lysophospholipid acyltransferase family protein [Candidatus Marinimicrobia bacterium]|jgi:1-acyl-sn-glycerol-3-phosphate acyltransferase|nr:1-acyl-sn-glycerol-3-phosphate acyltransferase [bacterium]MDA7641442.1 1-acyl-sn-glycerol-3-phosphate acyltransferase [Candidatus Neomarinimicrobiota bacterium]MDA9841233.1 1-acyl-sn-glycerol-3-phosphate acyltransferase [Candidatus Neomarinimicrobiota bacterium]MDC0593875.1 1-acyl-sn-glycerol-3-phosphate acyltransferase [Candidatus Neomarinimicrobiota bacterium]MDC0654283.1 1-acyl-sn-glycerol-3-phosphate acyltransferase [Candidatus Neomarinimicrobiota bacterium]|tara:strand:- start:5797 stop:6339 length:543 start_codon:yes stop_codon:yes gene_type:complete